MKLDNLGRCGVVRAGVAAILAGLVGGCSEQSVPAPVFMRGAGDPVAAALPAPPPALQVIVRRGQTVEGYAYTYHLPKAAIIAANGLRPPYMLREGQRLTIPSPAGYTARPVPQAALAPMPRPLPPVSPVAAPTPLSPVAVSPPPPQAVVQQQLPPPQTTIPRPPPTPQTIAPVASAGPPPQTIFPAAAAPAPIPAKAAAPQPVVAPPTAQGAVPLSSAAKPAPDIIPLDGPPPKEAAATPPAQAAAGAAPVIAPRNPAAALPLPGEDPNRQATAAAAPAAGGRFPWPVRGRIVGNYGDTPGGGHNDGINIAAPLGTPVRAIDAGTVAYAGNEVKGYGNIVLIKHANGLISAYAHLDDVGVKAGDTIAPGQVIAKVGESGGVSQPQLHFELRRGKTPVDPRDFLSLTPSAEAITANKRG